MQVRQNSTDHAHVQQAGVTGAFATSALAQTATLRTLALIATISLVAFALYMTHPPAEQAAVKGAHIHMSDSPDTVGHAAAQQEDDSTSQTANSQSSNSANVHNEITVNGKSIPVPDNGNVHKTVTDGNTTTTIDVSNSGTSVSTNSVSVQSSSSSSSSTEPQEP